jgi:hypothetical protein
LAVLPKFDEVFNQIYLSSFIIHFKSQNVVGSRPYCPRVEKARVMGGISPWKGKQLLELVVKEVDLHLVVW